MRFYKSHKELGNAYQAGEDATLPLSRPLTANCPFTEIYNADEFGLFFTKPPTTTIDPALFLGKKRKECLTFTVSVNVDGSDNIPSPMIGSARQPRCFNGFSAARIDLDSDLSGKAFMNTTIFNRWIYRLDKYVNRKPIRKILLLLDNASTHGNTTNLPLYVTCESNFD